MASEVIERAGKTGLTNPGGALLGLADPTPVKASPWVGDLGFESSEAARQAAELYRNGMYHTPTTNSAGAYVESSDINQGGVNRSPNALMTNMGIYGAPDVKNPYLDQLTVAEAFGQDVGGRQAADAAQRYTDAAGQPLMSPSGPVTGLGDITAQASRLRGIANGATTNATTQFQAGLQGAQAGLQSAAAGVRGAQGAAARRNATESSYDVAARGAQSLAAQQADERNQARMQLQDANTSLETAGAARSGVLAQQLDPAQQLQAAGARADAARQQQANWAIGESNRANQTDALGSGADLEASNSAFNESEDRRLRQLAANYKLRQYGMASGVPVAITPADNAARTGAAQIEANQNAATMGAIGAGVSQYVRDAKKKEDDKPKLDSWEDVYGK